MSWHSINCQVCGGLVYYAVVSSVNTNNVGSSLILCQNCWPNQKGKSHVKSKLNLMNQIEFQNQLQKELQKQKEAYKKKLQKVSLLRTQIISDKILKFISFVDNINLKEKQLAQFTSISLKRVIRKTEEFFNHTIFKEVKTLIENILVQRKNYENKIKEVTEFMEKRKEEMEQFKITFQRPDNSIKEGNSEKQYLQLKENLENALTQAEIQAVVAIYQANITKSKQRTQMLSNLIAEGQLIIPEDKEKNVSNEQLPAEKQKVQAAAKEIPSNDK